jgi:hypothetical protein
MAARPGGPKWTPYFLINLKVIPIKIQKINAQAPRSILGGAADGSMLDKPKH